MTGSPSPRRGEIWLAEMDKTRPAVVMHRDFAGRVLNHILVAPLTTTMRDIPTAVRLGAADGVDRDCIALLDALTLLRRDRFIQRIGALSAERMIELCRALAIAVACEGPVLGR
ncbi:MAG: type II toxin-antitoxin system PemK/MazF family toxin [Solirubrobacteraceae bacterium]